MNILTALQELETIHLKQGEHEIREDGMCVMEAAAKIADEKHTDHPDSVSVVIGAFLREWNDSVDDKFRQRLKPFIPRIIGTAYDGRDRRRTCLAADWLVRVCVPAFVDLAKFSQFSSALRSAGEIVDDSSAESVLPDVVDTLIAVREEGVKPAPLHHATSVARFATRVAAVNAAWDAVAETDHLIPDSLCKLASKAVDVAWWAAWLAARGPDAKGSEVGSDWEASESAESVARETLRPTVEMMQASALSLLDRMIEAA